MAQKEGLHLAERIEFAIETSVLVSRLQRLTPKLHSGTYLNLN
jgi:hypothetical protein